MKKNIFANRVVVIYLICYLIIGAVIARMTPYYLSTRHEAGVLGLLGLYVLLFSTERFISLRLPAYMHLYFLAQIAISVFLLLYFPGYDSPQDYFSLLLVPPCFQAVWWMERRPAIFWVGVFSLASLASLVMYFQINEGSWEGLGYGLANTAAVILVAGFGSVTRTAEEARSRSQALLGELQVANRRLQEYSRQVEELAAAEERNRLARDLHDSVSQTIFSMTLTAQAARILLERDPARVAAQLDHLQTLAQNALAEMRSLIQHLRPVSLASDGLAGSLRRHVIERQVRDGLEVELEILSERRLPEPVEECLFRVTQEALNNVVKHARTKQAWVRLDLGADPVTLNIEDRGAGFDLAAARRREGRLGLAGMQERIGELGGTITIDSAPGAGTRIQVEMTIAEEA